MSMTQQQQSQSSRWLGGESPFAVEARVLDERTAQQVLTEQSQSQAVRGVVFQRDEYGTPHIRVEFTPEAIASGLQDHIRRLTEPIQRSYESAGSSRGQQQ